MLKVGIIGATGYTGKELLKTLLGHPKVKVELLSAKIDQKEIPISEIFKEFSRETDLVCQNFEGASTIARSVDLVFTCLPHRVSMEIVPALLDTDRRVIDLSADFRLKDTSIYQQWYGVEHKYPELITRAVYGLPELYRDKIRKAQLVANPGCYPTAVILALAPLVKEGLIDLASIIIDAKTGISGAGRNPTLVNYFPERQENLTPYKVTFHQHVPEIEQELSKLAGTSLRITFTPHLAPINRGILASTYLTLNMEERVRDLYLDFYRDEPFVRILDEGVAAQTKDVCGSNYCDLAIFNDERINTRLIVISAIDNLVKGAAGQAVQNMNIMCGFDETTGLKLS